MICITCKKSIKEAWGYQCEACADLWEKGPPLMDREGRVITTDAKARIAELERERDEARKEAKVFLDDVSALGEQCETVRKERDALKKMVEKLRNALNRLYEENVDYIQVNNLGDPLHNESMKSAKEALALKPEDFTDGKL